VFQNKFEISDQINIRNNTKHQKLFYFGKILLKISAFYQFANRFLEKKSKKRRAMKNKM
jgi:hypothetical protein